MSASGPSWRSSKRADVSAACVSARDEVRALSSEGSGPAYLAQVKSLNVVGTTLAGQPDQRNLR